ncbi:hypothetical protein NECID01_1923 [Nematocida sp. AWRm77]|nr:hypothetical protein NECID01_1923 [Nematocida sp. AWRm77]
MTIDGEEKQVEANELSFSRKDIELECTKIEKAFRTLQLTGRDEKRAWELAVIARGAEWERIPMMDRLVAIKVGLAQQKSREARILVEIISAQIIQFLQTPEEEKPTWENLYDKIAETILHINDGNVIEHTEKLEKHGSYMKWYRDITRVSNEYQPVTWERAISILLAFDSQQDHFQAIFSPNQENWKGLQKICSYLDARQQGKKGSLSPHKETREKRNVTKKVCQLCQKVGHTALDCYMFKKNKTESTEKEDKQISINQHSRSNPQARYLTLQLGSTQISAQEDSGADVSFISTDLAHKILRENPQITIEKYTEPLMSLQTEIKSKSQLEAIVTYKGIKLGSFRFCIGQRINETPRVGRDLLDRIQELEKEIQEPRWDNNCRNPQRDTDVKSDPQKDNNCSSNLQEKIQKKYQVCQREHRITPRKNTE